MMYEKKDSEFLEWIHDRLVEVHGENDLTDYMGKLRRVISRVKCVEKFLDNLEKTK
jgi:hypothetical protein